MKKKQTPYNDRIIAERLEPRVLFSADPLGLAVGALLLDDQHTYDTPVSYEPFSEINIAAPEADHAPAPVELIFIDIRADSSREDIQAILAQDRGNAIVHVIDSQTGGIDSISKIIAQHDSIGSIHFLVHGDNQGLRIGADWLDIDSIDGFKNEFSSWDQYLTEDADVLLYGCDLTAGSDGLSLIEQLATLTGADVAASEDKTGHESRDANWVLEDSTGTIETASLGVGSVEQGWVGVLDLILVDTNADIVDGDTSSISALQLDMGTDNAISLREALIAANNTPGIDEIQLEAEDYNLNAGADEDSAATGDLDILEGVVISGVSSQDTSIDAGNEDRVFDIFATDVTMENLSIDNSTVVGNGGAIQIHTGTTRLDSVVVDNSVASGAGGNIYISSGNLIIDNSNIRHGAAGTDGGGIAVVGSANIDINNTIIHHSVAAGNGAGLALLGTGDATITDSYIHRNITTTGDGGGLFSVPGGSLTITNTTFVINEAILGGGAYIDGDIQLTNTTFSDNEAKSEGGGLYLASGTATIQNNTFTKNDASSGDSTGGDAIKISASASAIIGNTIIADNKNPARPDVVGTVVSNGFNLLSDNDPAFDAITDILAGDANLDNIPEISDTSLIGTGNVPTHTPQTGSDAIDAGGTRTGTDANGFTANTFSDIGAVEADPAATGKKLFWADSNGWIYRANEDGSGIQQIFETDNAPGDIEYDPGTGRIFWSETDGQWGSVRSTDINGNDLQEITSSIIGDRLMSPRGIAIDAVGRFLYVHSDIVLSPSNAPPGTENKIDRYIINNDGSMIFDSEIYAGSPYSNPEPQISQARDLEYTTNLDGREALIWNDAGNPAGALPETVPQINIWDLTPGPNTNPNLAIVPMPTGTFDARGLAVDPISGTVYFSLVNDNVVAMTVNLGTQVATYNDAAEDEFLFGLQFDESTDTLWWTEIDGATGNIGSFLTSLGTYEYKLSYSGSPVALALADITPVNTAPVATEDTYTIDEGGTLADATASVLDNDTDVDGPAPLSATLVSGPANATAFTLNANGTFSYTHNNSETTTDSFTYTANDATTGVSAVTTVTLTVTPVNDNDPIAVADAYTLDEGSTLAHATASVLDNDTDLDAPNDSMSAVLVSGPANAAAFTLNANGTFSYTHNDSETTTDSFTYTANDAATGVSAVTTVTLTVTPVNDNDPVAVADAYTLDEGSTLAHATNSVLDNDTDLDAPNDSMSAVLVSGPANAAAFTLNANGTFSYTHNDSETTTDSFTYTANDAATGVSAVTTVTLTVTPVNDNDPVAVADAYTLDEGSTLAHATNSVLDNDTDLDAPNDSMSAVLVSGPANAAAFTLNANGTFSYTHNDSETTTDSFTYTANDAATGVSAVTTVTLTVTPVNDNDPVAVADAYTLDEGSTLAHATNSVLDNDTDLDAPNDSMSAVLVSGPANAAAFTLNANGTFSYTHNDSETTTDSFTYTANDAATGVSAVTTVTLTVTPVNDNDPVAVADAYTLDEGSTLAHATNSVLDNDTDLDAPNDSMSAVLVSGPANAAAFTLNANGTFSYTHNDSETTTDSFTYTANDAATGVSAVTTVTLTVTPVNDNDPVAVADAYTLDEGSTLAHATNSVLDNDTDLDAPNDSMSAVLVSGPANAAAFTLNANGTFSYTHNDSETTTDSFTYTANDAATGVSAVTTVALTVTPVNDNDPVAVADAYTLDEGSTLAHATNSVLDNDTDLDAPNDSMSAVLVSGPANAAAFTLNANGTFSYTHNDSETTTDSFTYTANDAATGVSAVTTVTLTVTSVNDNTPIAVTDKIVVDENDTANTLEFGQTSLLHNDTDDDILNGMGDTLTVVPVPLTLTTNGSIQIFADGTFEYINNGNEDNSDSFDYTVVDAVGNTDTITVQVEINPVNDAPIAVNDTDNVDEGGVSTKLPGNIGSILTNDSDPENDILTASIVEGPSHGTLTLDPSTGTFSYTHDGSETTEDSYIYAATDASGASNNATVTITISEINDDPVTEDDEYTVSEGGLLAHPTASVLDNDTDAENEALTAEFIGTGPANALSFEFLADGTFSYQHDGSETTTDSFTYIAKDTRTGVSTLTTVSIVISETDDTPIGANDIYNVDEGGLLDDPTASVLDNDTDVDSNALTVELVTGPSNSTAFTLLTDGKFSYQHDGSETTEDSFTYVTRDLNNVSNEVEVTITINPINDVPVPVSFEEMVVDEPETGNLTLPDNLFVDAEQEPMIYSVIEYTDGTVTASGLPTWLQFQPEDNSFVVTDQENATSISVLVVATDPNNGTSEPKTIILNYKPRLGAGTPDEVDAPENETAAPEVEPLVEETAEPTPSASQADIVNSASISITESTDFEHIDIASLIKPLPAIAVASVSATADFLADLAASETDDAIQFSNIEQLTFELTSSESLDRGLASLADTFDEQKELLEEAYNQSRSAIGRSITLTSGLSVGYLIWLIRGGTLMGSVLSSMPAWRLVDPLPILGTLGDDFEESDDSLESMVKNTE